MQDRRHVRLGLGLGSVACGGARFGLRRGFFVDGDERRFGSWVCRCFGSLPCVHRSILWQSLHGGKNGISIRHFQSRSIARVRALVICAIIICAGIGGGADIARPPVRRVGVRVCQSRIRWGIRRVRGLHGGRNGGLRLGCDPIRRRIFGRFRWRRQLGQGNAGYHHRILIAVQPLFGADMVGCPGGQAKIRLAAKARRFGNCHKGDRTKAVFFGKGIGLVQGFARNHGHFGQRAALRPVKHQIFDRIGGAPLKRSRNLGAAALPVLAGCLKLQIQDLAVGQDQLCAKSARRARLHQHPQPTQIHHQIRRVEGKLANHGPTRSAPLEQCDGLITQVEGKTRLHSGDLAWSGRPPQPPFQTRHW